MATIRLLTVFFIGFAVFGFSGSAMAQPPIYNAKPAKAQADKPAATQKKQPYLFNKPTAKKEKAALTPETIDPALLQFSGRNPTTIEELRLSIAMKSQMKNDMSQIAREVKNKHMMEVQKKIDAWRASLKTVDLSQQAVLKPQAESSETSAPAAKKPVYNAPKAKKPSKVFTNYR